MSNPPSWCRLRRSTRRSDSNRPEHADLQRVRTGRQATTGPSSRGQRLRLARCERLVVPPELEHLLHRRSCTPRGRPGRCRSISERIVADSLTVAPWATCDGLAAADVDSTPGCGRRASEQQSSAQQSSAQPSSAQQSSAQQSSAQQSSAQQSSAQQSSARSRPGRRRSSASCRRARPTWSAGRRMPDRCSSSRLRGCSRPYSGPSGRSCCSSGCPRKLYDVPALGVLRLTGGGGDLDGDGRREDQRGQDRQGDRTFHDLTFRRGHRPDEAPSNQVIVHRPIRRLLEYSCSTLDESLNLDWRDASAAAPESSRLPQAMPSSGR